MRKTRISIATALVAVGALSFGTAGASAAHCVSPDGTSPGFSYFGTGHVQSTDHNGEEPGQPEGGKNGPHAGTSGASNCRETAGSPSGRAPGQAG